MSDPQSLPANVVEALERGDAIEAIKRLRQATGLGLKEAKDLIDQHARGETVTVSAAVPLALSPVVIEALQRGNKIEAIRLLREQTGLGLKEAKDAIEASPQAAPASSAVRAPGEVPRSGSLLWWAAIGAIFALAIYVVSGFSK